MLLRTVFDSAVTLNPIEPNAPPRSGARDASSIAGVPVPIRQPKQPPPSMPSSSNPTASTPHPSVGGIAANSRWIGQNMKHRKKFYEDKKVRKYYIFLYMKHLKPGFSHPDS